VLELLVAFGTAPSGPLLPLVGPQGKVHLLEQASDSAWAGRMPRGRQLFTEVPEATPHPLLLAHRVAGYLISKQLLQGGNDRRVFHFGQLGTGAREAYAVMLPLALGLSFGFRVGHRATGGGLQVQEFAQTGRNGLSRQSRGGSHAADATPADCPRL